MRVNSTIAKHSFATMKIDFEDLADRLLNSEQPILTTHQSPDGDAIGSTVGLSRVMRALGANPTVIVPDAVPDFLTWMTEGLPLVCAETEQDRARELIEAADVVVSLDYNHFSRTGVMSDWLDSSKALKILIDHHREPADYYDFTISDIEASSTCELVYELMKQLNWQQAIDKSVAECLYTGIMTDTGSFRFASVSARTHRIVADLIDRGLEPEPVHRLVSDQYSLDRLRLIGYALYQKLEFNPDTAAAIISLSRRELQSFSFRKGDTEGLVNYGLSIKGARLAVLATEDREFVKFSFRSVGDIDVNQFSRMYFNGGGHKNAAGGRLQMPFSEAIDYLKIKLNEAFA
ncbi:MAG: bifunctional oligoribonuclease/PAP phosphatase NrnA [Salibacteraceae bacterium]